MLDLIVQGPLVPKLRLGPFLTLSEWAQIKRLGFWDPGPYPE